jgi:hypothetical protein
VTVIHAVPAASAAIEIVERALLPFDFAHFKVVPRSIPPIKNLPPEQLLSELAEEDVYAELCPSPPRTRPVALPAGAPLPAIPRRRISRTADHLYKSTAHGFESDGTPFRAGRGDANGALHTGGIQASRARGMKFADENGRSSARVASATRKPGRAQRG